MNYYDEIRSRLIDNEVYLRIKDYSKEKHTLITHYEVGKLLAEAGIKYGEGIISNYSKKLSVEVAQKYNQRTLRRMRQLYLFFENHKWSPMGTELSISHIRELFCLKDTAELDYYVEQIKIRNLSKRQLAAIIKNNEYKRLSEETKNKLINKQESKIVDFIKNPIQIKNSNNYEILTEKILQKLLLENISAFLEELGEGFTFIKNEYKIKLGSSYNYIDFLLFNYKYNCFVVVELKVTELKKEHIGQIQVYMNYIDHNLRSFNHNKTIGIIICRKNNKYVIEYCSDDRIVAREYEFIQ